jgi:hypothetical protein
LSGPQICVWSVKTGRLLDVLAGHEGPVCGLAFSPSQPILASCSWDKTVRLWDVYDGAGCVETLQHGHDVLAVAYRWGRRARPWRPGLRTRAPARPSACLEPGGGPKARAPI